MKLAVTGAAGFLGWHVRCALRARGVGDVSALDRAEWGEPGRLRNALAGADAVLHLSGINRAGPDELRDGNLGLATALTAALDDLGIAPAVVFADSVQCGNGTPFGDGKQAAAAHLAAWGRRTGASVADVLLPNLFGEHGRPHYNSVVATFCHQLASGSTPVVEQDRELPLLHGQDAAGELIDLAVRGDGGVVRPQGRPMTVSALLELLRGFHAGYATGDIPDITDPLHLALFNTYRSFTFPQQFPIETTIRADERGRLFEAVRSRGGQGHVFCSTTRPGYTRGEHFHLRKIERFLVLSGTAMIALRRLFHDTVVEFEVSGDRPAVVDMPTMWAHSITNVGTGELMTLFWAHEILDPDNADTYAERVRGPVERTDRG